MRIIITTTEKRAEQYAAYVAEQIEEGCTMGHWDAEHHWVMEDDPKPAPTEEPTEAVAEFKGVRATITESAGSDGARLVLIDTDFEPGASDGGPGLRVLVNDHPTYEGVHWAPADEEDEEDARLIRKYDGN